MKYFCFRVALALIAGALTASAQFAGWRNSGSVFILTTPEGANLPAEGSVTDFPALVRLESPFFNFAEASPNGDDIRFADESGAPLAYQIDEWDAARGVAAVWVRVPKISGNARQRLKVAWGNPQAKSESSGAAVFNAANGFVSVWHLGASVADDAGAVTSRDVGTTAVRGMIGEARHLAGKQGIFGGESITNLPAGSSENSTEAWFRAEKSNGRIVGWGNEQGQGKVVMQFRSPPHINVDCYFSDGNVSSTSRLPLGEWVHVVHTYRKGDARVYVNGVLDGASQARASALNIRTPARLWIGGWYNNYDFVGDLDEVRISRVARSAEWVRLEYENQKPMHTLVGPVVRDGKEFSVSASQLTVAEGASATVTARASGAQKVFWVLKRDGRESAVAVDKLAFAFDAGRVVGDAKATLQLRAVYPDEVKTADVAITIRESVPEPEFTLNAPRRWDGRATIEVVPAIRNLAAMRAAGAGELRYDWSVIGGAVIKEIAADRLVLKRSQFTGPITVRCAISNGGLPTIATTTINVTEPAKDAWVQRLPEHNEKPVDNQFYARDDAGEGTLFYNGTLDGAADAVFLRVFADEKIFKTETQKPGADKSYAFAVRLKPGLIKYRVEFGASSGGKETILNSVTNLVCGDAFLIDGQSNALATDTREDAPRETSEWIRSYGRPTGNASDASANLWCYPVWKARKDDKAELGWWGMDLAKRLVASQKVPIFMINAAVGGTRIDQHQRNAAEPTDLTTIYGRMLWRVRQARLTHGIRGILWHQGENDQGADGPTGGFGWETYQPFFVEMAAAWKTDFPNVKHYYVYQIWPNACAMGGRDGSGDMLREVQRTLPRLFSNMDIMSTLGIRPPGGCHFPLEGWSHLARLVQPMIERDHYGRVPTALITPPNLRSARFAGAARDAVTLEFDQPVVWSDGLASQFYLDGEKEKVASGSVAGNVLTLKLKEPSRATKITYLKEIAWNQETLLNGANAIAALTFRDVAIEGK
jgi:hypothetical protein